MFTGKPANILVDNVFSGAAILRQVGETLASLHSVPPPRDFRQYVTGVGTKDAMFDGAAPFRDASAAANVTNHPFLSWFEQRLPNFAKALADPSLPVGLMHCDCFLDNCLLDSQPDRKGGVVMNAIIDWEDAAVGPLAHDLAICVLGCCYQADATVPDPIRLTALLQGYQQRRCLLSEEADSLLGFVKGCVFLHRLCKCCMATPIGFSVQCSMTCYPMAS